MSYENDTIDQAALENLGPGCFVKVKLGENCFWAEITHKNGRSAGGYIHRELATSACRNALAVHEVAFDEDQVKELGCEKYCWC